MHVYCSEESVTVPPHRKLRPQLLYHSQYQLRHVVRPHTVLYLLLMQRARQGSAVLHSNTSQEFANLHQLFCVLIFSIVSKSTRITGPHISLGWVSLFRYDTALRQAQVSLPPRLIRRFSILSHNSYSESNQDPVSLLLSFHSLLSWRIPKTLTMEKPAVARRQSKWALCSKLSARTHFCTNHQHCGSVS